MEGGLTVFTGESATLYFIGMNPRFNIEGTFGSLMFGLGTMKDPTPEGELTTRWFTLPNIVLRFIQQNAVKIYGYKNIVQYIIRYNYIFMETKNQLVQSIREWVRIDNEMRKLKSEVSKRRKVQKTISESLIRVMRDNEIDEFELNDGKITYNKRNVKKPITQKILLGILANYYQGDVKKAVEVNNYIMENREEVEVEKISRKMYFPENPSTLDTNT
jgi:hypothetical protein